MLAGMFCNLYSDIYFSAHLEDYSKGCAKLRQMYDWLTQKQKEAIRK